MAPWRFPQRSRRQPKARQRRSASGKAGVTDWPRLLERDDVLILDTETTGLDGNAEIIDIALIDTRGATRFNALAMPGRPVPREASRIHGITDAMLRRHKAPDWPTLYAQLRPLLDAATLVVVYNAAYDRRLLQQTCALHGLAPPDLVWRCAMLDYAAYRREMHPCYQNYRWHKLEAAWRRECRVPAQQPQEHRALGDCRAVLALMRSVADRV